MIDGMRTWAKLVVSVKMSWRGFAVHDQQDEILNLRIEGGKS